MTTTINKRDYIANLDTGEYGEYFADYNRGYICDIISEIADSNVDIYYHDLRQWAVDNYHWVEQAVSEGLVDTHDFDYHKAIQCGQYVAALDDLYEHMEDCILLAILEDLDTDELTHEQLERIELLACDSNDRLESLICDAEDIIAD